MRSAGGGQDCPIGYVLPRRLQSWCRNGCRCRACCNRRAPLYLHRRGPASATQPRRISILRQVNLEVAMLHLQFAQARAFEFIDQQLQIGEAFITIYLREVRPASISA